MPRIHYTARTPAGETVEGEIRARDEQGARQQLQQQGLEMLAARMPAARVANPLRGLFKPVKTRALATATGQLALMLSTGTSLVDSLQALADQAKEQRLGEILTSVAGEVSAGSTLAVALEAHPGVFDGFYISAVRSGEATGRLPDVFKRLEKYLEKRLELRASMITALIYPAVVTTMAIFAVTFVVTFVLPKFVDIFERSNVALPMPTRMLMAISGFVVSYWYLLLAALIAAPTAVYFYVKSPRGSKVADAVMLKLPVVGALTNMVQSSMLLRTMGTLLEAGVPLYESLGVAKDACTNGQFRQFATDVSAGIVRGEDLGSNFRKSDLMSPSIKQMITTGERTGRLPMVLAAITDHLDATADRQMKRLSAVFEPLIIIVMGVVIGFIAVSVLLPLFRLSSAARGGG